MRIYKGIITELPENGIFVYGANTEGRHGKGAALLARQKFGAKYGLVGLQGQSYGIVTKDLTKRVHPSISESSIRQQISNLYYIAKNSPEKDYYVVYSGSGVNLNGYTNKEMAVMFNDNPPPNVIFEEGFAKLMKELE